MQLYARELLRGLRKRNEIDVRVVGYRGSVWLLPFFLCFALLRTLFFRGTHVHFGDALSACCVPIVRFFRPRLRLSVTVYGLDLTYPHFFYQRMIRACLPQVDRIVAISRSTALEAENRGVASDRIAVIPCGIDCDVSVRKEATSAHDLLLLGRQIPRKGTRWFLSAVVPRLLVLYPDLRVTIGGDGSELPMIRSDIERLGLSSCVHAFGSVSEEKKNVLYGEAGLFVMPNIEIAGDMEGFGLVCVEAAARGLPVVAARLQGIEDAVIEDQTGVFFSAEDGEDCMRAIEKAWSIRWHPEAMNQLCRRHFSVETMTSAYLRHVFF